MCSNGILYRGKNHWNNNKRKFKIVYSNAPYLVPGTKQASEFFPWVLAILLQSLNVADDSPQPLGEIFWREIGATVEDCHKPSAKKRKRSFGSLYGDKWEELTGEYWTKTEFYFISRSFFLVPNTSTDFFYFILCYRVGNEDKDSLKSLEYQKKTGSNWNSLD